MAAPLSWLIPPRIALQILLTGDPDLTAQRGYEIGLVNEVVPLADLRSRAQELAERIAANAPLSVLAAKRTAYLSRPDVFEAAERIWAAVYHARIAGGRRVPRQAAARMDRPLSHAPACGPRPGLTAATTS